MAASKEQMQSWALGRITAAFPPSEAMTAIDDLYRVAPFFAGESALLFGMKTTPDAFADPAQLIERSRAGLRAWFDHFGAAGELEQQAKLYPAIRANDPAVPEPELVRRRHEAHEAYEAAKRAAVAKLPRPIEAVARVSKSLALAIQAVRGARPDDFFSAHGRQLVVEGDPTASLGNFEWLAADPEWDELVEAAFDPPFFPFAGADGDYVGVFVSEEETPVVYFSHEEGFFLAARNLELWNAMCDAAARDDVRRKRRAPSNGLEPPSSNTAYDAAFTAARAALNKLDPQRPR